MSSQSTMFSSLITVSRFKAHRVGSYEDRKPHTHEKILLPLELESLTGRCPQYSSPAIWKLWVAINNLNKILVHSNHLRSLIRKHNDAAEKSTLAMWKTYLRKGFFEEQRLGSSPCKEDPDSSPSISLMSSIKISHHQNGRRRSHWADAWLFSPRISTALSSKGFSIFSKAVQTE